MKKTALSILSVAFIAMTAVGGNPPADATTYKVDTKESTVEWLGEKVTGEHNGTIQLESGMLKFKNEELVGGEFAMDMSTIKNNDLEGEYNTKLVNHLKSSDFFHAEKFPTSKLVLTKVVHQGRDYYKIEGDLTIKGITKPIEFTATVTQDGDKVLGKGEIVIDRAEYNVRYGSGSFFDDLGDKTIYDEFTLTVNLVAKK